MKIKSGEKFLQKSSVTFVSLCLCGEIMNVILSRYLSTYKEYPLRKKSYIQSLVQQPKKAKNIVRVLAFTIDQMQTIQEATAAWI
jgi:hypothetical protein